MFRKDAALKLILMTLGISGHLAFASEGCVIGGPEDAQVTIQEFSDFHCPYCKKGSSAMSEVLKNYPKEVKLVFRNLPLPGHGPEAVKAAKAFAAVCLQSPALAQKFQAELFSQQDKLKKESDSFLFEAADKIGANVPQMRSEMESAAVAKSIAEDQRIAESRDINGTPSFIIGNQTIVGARSYADFKKIIDEQIAGK